MAQSMTKKAPQTSSTGSPDTHDEDGFHGVSCGISGHRYAHLVGNHNTDRTDIIRSTTSFIVRLVGTHPPHYFQLELFNSSSPLEEEMSPLSSLDTLQRELRTRRLR